MVAPRTVLFAIVLFNCVFFGYTYPTLGNNTTLERRQCSYDGSRWVCNQYLPTLGQWVARMRDPNWVTGTRPETVTWFYTNLASLADMHDVDERARLWTLCVHWIIARGLGHTWYGNSVEEAWIKEQDKMVTGSTWAAELTAQFGSVKRAQNNYNNCQSHALALAALSPEVFIFTRGSGHEPLDDSTWNEAEFWPMTRAGGQVRAIWRVDPRLVTEINDDLPPGTAPLTTCPEPELIWLRGRDPPLPQIWKCPVTYDDGTIPGVIDPFDEQYEQPSVPVKVPTAPFQFPLAVPKRLQPAPPLPPPEPAAASP